MKHVKQNNVTEQQYKLLQDAYNYFNEHLFNNELPQCLITLQRKGKNNYGYFHPDRFAQRVPITSKKSAKKKKIAYIAELALNPDNFVGRSDTDIMSTLVHEQCHVKCHYLVEKPGRGGYHDKKWGAIMKEIGLYPSNTGKPGGKETGQQMTHYMIAGGKYEKAAKKFLTASRKLQWNSMPILSMGTSKRNKVKYCCPSCELTAWGKPNLNIVCGECGEQLQEE